MFFVIGIPSCYVLPCFGAGCHASNFKIATAALRPRNDTKSGRFCLENRRFFVLCGRFLRGVALRPIHTFQCKKLVGFSQKPTSFVSLRGGRVRPTRQSLTNRFAIPERTMVARNETEPWKEDRGSRMKQRIHVFCDRDFFLLRAPVLRSGMPYLWLKDCHGRNAASQ